MESAFQDVIIAFLNLQKDPNLQIDKTLVVGESCSNISLCGISLKTILSRFNGNRDAKSAIHALFCHATVLSNQWDDFVNPDNIYKEFTFNGRNAQYLAVASANNMVAISLPIENQLKKDKLEISVSDTQSQTNESSWYIDNWYKDNTDAIRQQLLPKETTKLEVLVNLFLGMGKNVVFSEKFKDQWDNEIKNDRFKDRIIKRFKEANDNKLLFPAKDDPREPKYKIVRKDVNCTNVFELRLRDSGVRIYFVCDDSIIKILLYGTKTNHQGFGQESDFRTANEILNRVKTNGRI